MRTITISEPMRLDNCYYQLTGSTAGFEAFLMLNLEHLATLRVEVGDQVVIDDAIDSTVLPHGGNQLLG